MIICVLRRINFKSVSVHVFVPKPTFMGYFTGSAPKVVLAKGYLLMYSGTMKGTLIV